MNINNPSNPTDLNMGTTGGVTLNSEINGANSNSDNMNENDMIALLNDASPAVCLTNDDD